MPRSITELFSNDNNIWGLALIAMGIVLLFMVAKSIVVGVARRVRNRNERPGGTYPR